MSARNPERDAERFDYLNSQFGALHADGQRAIAKSKNNAVRLAHLKSRLDQLREMADWSIANLMKTRRQMRASLRENSSLRKK